MRFSIFILKICDLTCADHFYFVFPIENEMEIVVTKIVRRNILFYFTLNLVDVVLQSVHSTLIGGERQTV